MRVRVRDMLTSEGEGEGGEACEGGGETMKRDRPVLQPRTSAFLPGVAFIESGSLSLMGEIDHRGSTTIQPSIP